ncbi:FecR family protein [Peristeroidobacter soli]|uniref:FecR family protein n=1 Tax=Peristeroidobacter soli TaxID=2497877 RepID=UPI00158BDE49|nr:FecR family protein [Peristeroidobacter soli]
MESLQPHEDDPVREAAARWHERLRDENVTEALRKEFDAWRMASAAHQKAFDRVSETWRALQAHATAAPLLALRHETALMLTRRNRTAARPLAWAAGFVLAMAGLLAVTQLSLRPFGRSPEHYATAVGERLTATLPDGSHVTLNSGSELRLAFQESERRVRLMRGQALFEVAKDPTRPFVVEATGRRFVALGTVFDVRIDGHQVLLTMLEGSVRVEPRMPSKQVALAPLTAGEQLRIDGGEVATVRTTDAEKVTSWRRGQVIFEGTRLAEAIAEINRYSDVQIELLDPKLADLKISGAFATGRPELFVEALTGYFPIESHQAGGKRIVLEARR